jgi:predicted HicB family RNase H-like nuclease
LTAISQRDIIECGHGGSAVPGMTPMPSGLYSSEPETNRDAQSDLQRPQAMEHRGYTGVSFVDEESESLYGHVIGLRDVITFQGDSVAELTQSFRDSVDDYLEFCQSLGRSPEKPYSGRFLLRIPPALHRALSNAAEKTGVSINSLIESILESATHKKRPRVNW